MAIDVGRVIQINTRTSVGGVPAAEFGLGLLLTTKDAIAAGGSGKVQEFSSHEAVLAAFSGANALAAAATWFSADPPPKALLVGRWASADVPTTLRGGAAPSAVSALAVANATFTVGGNTVTVNLSSAGTYDAVATAIQTAIRALSDTRFNSSAVTYTDGRFLLTLSGADDIGGSFGTAGTGTDISAGLGMAEASSPVYHVGHDAETVQEAVTEMVGLLGQTAPVALLLDDGVPGMAGTPAVNTVESLREYAEANDYIFFFADTSTQALATADATSQLALAFAAQQGNVVGLYSMDGTRPDVALAALMSSQSLDSRASIITPHAKPLPGALPSIITDTQYSELLRKRANVYETVLGLPSFLGGFTARDSTWLDAQWWLLWLKDRLERALWGVPRSSRRATAALVLDAVTAVMQAAVANGGLEPGRVLSATNRADVQATTGNREFNGVLTAGYLVWVDPEPSVADVQSRLGRLKVWGTGSPAIHRVIGDVVFQN